MCIALCLIEAIIRIFTTILLMFDSMIRMFLYNLYNILSVFCQICSVLPLCIVFILTSNLKCLLCNRSNICCAGAQAQCPMLTSLVMLIVLYIILNAFHALDPIFGMLGYVKEHQKSMAEGYSENKNNTFNLTSKSSM